MNAIGKWLLNAATSYVVGTIVDSTVQIVVPLVRATINNIRADLQGHPGYVEVDNNDCLTEGYSSYKINSNEEG